MHRNDDWLILTNQIPKMAALTIGATPAGAGARRGVDFVNIATCVNGVSSSNNICRSVGKQRRGIGLEWPKFVFLLDIFKLFVRQQKILG